MKIQLDWQALRQHRYMPQYRLPAFISCFLLFFFLSILGFGALIFLGGPILLSYLKTIDSSPSAEMLQVQLGAELEQGSIRLVWQDAQSDGGLGYWLSFEKISADASRQTLSFYYLPGINEFWILPDAGYLRLHRLQGETLELQWIIDGS